MMAGNIFTFVPSTKSPYSLLHLCILLVAATPVRPHVCIWVGRRCMACTCHTLLVSRVCLVEVFVPAAAVCLVGVSTANDTVCVSSTANDTVCVRESLVWAEGF